MTTTDTSVREMELRTAISRAIDDLPNHGLHSEKIDRILAALRTTPAETGGAGSASPISSSPAFEPAYMEFSRGGDADGAGDYRDRLARGIAVFLAESDLWK